MIAMIATTTAMNGMTRGVKPGLYDPDESIAAVVGPGDDREPAMGRRASRNRGPEEVGTVGSSARSLTIASIRNRFRGASRRVAAGGSRVRRRPPSSNAGGCPPRAWPPGSSRG